MTDDVKRAFFIVWILVSIIFLGVLSLPFVLPNNVILDLAPRCEWIAKYNEPCPLCGMTKAFLEISRLNLKEALLYNRFSIYLYLFLSINSALFLLWSLISLARKLRPGKKV
ncbi:MAG: DUF2752 domain-containing protein [Bacillota bacterium]